MQVRPALETQVVHVKLQASRAGAQRPRRLASLLKPALRGGFFSAHAIARSRERLTIDRGLVQPVLALRYDFAKLHQPHARLVPGFDLFEPGPKGADIVLEGAHAAIQITK